MTDKVSCTGVHKTGPKVQLSDDGFYVSVQGGVKGVKVRYDDNPAEGMRLGTDMEKKIGAVMFTGGDFQKVLQSKRVRLQVMTILDRVSESDLDITGIVDAHNNILAGCPATGASTKAGEAKVLDKPVGCSEKVLAVLRAKGLSEKAIAEVCAP